MSNTLLRGGRRRRATQTVFARLRRRTCRALKTVTSRRHATTNNANRYVPASSAYPFPSSHPPSRLQSRIIRLSVHLHPSPQNLGENGATCPFDCIASSGCGDKICTPPETAATCPVDCGGAVGSCGNGVCDSGETISSCPVDCQKKCGDGACDPITGENISNCPQDCFCGNGVCNPERGETNGNCPQDCSCGNGVCETQKNENSGTCPQDCPLTTTPGAVPATGAAIPGAGITNPGVPGAATPGAVPGTTPAGTSPVGGTGTNPPAGGGVQTQTGSVQCNNDKFCDTSAGETAANCPLDCGGASSTPAAGTSGATVVRIL